MRKSLVVWLLLSGLALADSVPIGRGQNPDLCRDGSGRLWLAYERDGDIWLRSSQDNGQSWTEEAAVCHSPATSTQASLVVDSKGTPEVLWLEDGQVVFSRSADGRTFAPPTTVFAGRADSPDLAIDQDDGLHAVWVERSSASPDVFYSYSNQQSLVWSQGLNLSKTPGVSSQPTVSAGADASVQVAWLDTTSGNQRPDVFATERAPSGWSAPRNVSRTAGRSQSPAILVSGSHQVYLAWMDNSRSSSVWDIYFSRSQNDGTFSAPIFFDTPAESTDPCLASAESDRLAVAWVDSSQSGSNPDIFLVQSSDGGATFTVPQNISQSPGPSGLPTMVWNQEQYVIVWQEQEAGQLVLKLARQSLPRKPKLPVGSGKY
ncbi:MAG: exo-alpha-sialidase [Candidatus Eremiobacteraeota bacterium]|nr:exo-alpha-sialidase [Candidatus Eremiobacteraeota bacterium]